MTNWIKEMMGYNYVPVTERLNLKVDGTSPVKVTTTKNFTYITGVHIHMSFPTNDLKWEGFGAKATALTKGVCIKFGQHSLIGDQSIDHNGAFGLFFDKFTHLEDDKNPVGHTFNGSMNFVEHFGPFGLVADRLGSDKRLLFGIQDNLTHADFALVDFEALVIGAEIFF